jgi:hypothetical protein
MGHLGHNLNNLIIKNIWKLSFLCWYGSRNGYRDYFKRQVLGWIRGLPKQYPAEHIEYNKYRAVYRQTGGIKLLVPLQSTTIKYNCLITVSAEFNV